MIAFGLSVSGNVSKVLGGQVSKVIDRQLALAEFLAGHFATAPPGRVLERTPGWSISMPTELSHLIDISVLCIVSGNIIA